MGAGRRTAVNRGPTGSVRLGDARESSMARFGRRWWFVGLALVVATGVTAKPKPGHKPGKGHPGQHKPGGKQGADDHDATAKAIKPATLKWLLANNKGLPANFLRTEPASRAIRLPNGQTLPLYQLKQFLQVNFRLTFYPRKTEKGSEIVAVMEDRLQRLMALPKFHDWIKQHASTYRISPRGKVAAEQAYEHFRNIQRRLGVAVHKSYKAPNGGGDGIGAASWAVWKQMNIFEHEACHCIGIGHDSGGLSGPLAGELRQWDHKRLWDYKTVDVNALELPK